MHFIGTCFLFFSLAYFRLLFTLGIPGLPRVFVFMSKVINVPVEMIRRVRWDKTSLEMLVCAIIIKHKHQNSVLYDLRVANIKKLFGVSHNKAKKLIVAIKESDLFIYNEKKDCVFAKSFKSKTPVLYGRGRCKYTAFADYCRKMQLDDDIQLRKVVRELRNILALSVIDAQNYSKDNLIVPCKQRTNTVTKPASKAIPQGKLGYAMGFSRSSACRYIRRLIDDQRVSKTGIVAECVIPYLTEETEREYIERNPTSRFIVWSNNGGYSAWVIYGNTYSITSRKDSDAFKNVIHNYKRFATMNVRTSCENDGGKAWKQL